MGQDVVGSGSPKPWGKMQRRDFITLLGGAAVAPVAARAQQPAAAPVIGVLEQGAPDSYDLTGFRQGLKDAGYVEGQNLAIEYRWANDQPDRLRVSLPPISCAARSA